LHFVRDHEDVILPFVTKGRILLSTGDTVEYSAPGGGGYGFPMEREPLRVLRDVELGYVSLASAREDYGVVVLQSDHGLSIDETATAAVRKAV
jgi:N-methylhydantoinase B